MLDRDVTVNVFETSIRVRFSTLPPQIPTAFQHQVEPNLNWFEFAGARRAHFRLPPIWPRHVLDEIQNPCNQTAVDLLLQVRSAALRPEDGDWQVLQPKMDRQEHIC